MMKTTRKITRLLGILLCLCLVLGFALVESHAASPKTLTIGGVEVITSGTLQSGYTLPDGVSYDSATNTVTLANVTYTAGGSYFIYAENGDLNVKLSGKNVVNTSMSAIQVENGALTVEGTSASTDTLTGIGGLAADTGITLRKAGLTFKNGGTSFYSYTGSIQIMSCQIEVSIGTSAAISAGTRKTVTVWASSLKLTGANAIEAYDGTIDIANSHIVGTCPKGYSGVLEAKTINVDNAYFWRSGAEDCFKDESVAMDYSGKYFEYISAYHGHQASNTTVLCGCDLDPYGAKQNHNLYYTPSTTDATKHDHLCACGYYNGSNDHTFDAATTLCTDCGAQAAAKVNDTCYATVDAALTAALKLGSGTVTVLKDSTVNTTTSFAGETEIDLVVNEGVTLTVAETANWTWGGDLSGPGTVTIAQRVLSVYGEVKDDIKVESLDKESATATLVCRGEVSSGTFDCAVAVRNSGKITGGTFNGRVLAESGGTISGGTFSGQVENAPKGLITGGTFNGPVINSDNATITNANAGDFTLGEYFYIDNQGTINCTAHIWKDGACRLCAEPRFHTTYAPPTEDGGTGTCADCGVPLVVQVDDFYYTTFAGALEVWEESGGTLKLLANATYDYEICPPANEETVLDLNGWTLSTKAGINVEQDCNLTIKDSDTGGYVKYTGGGQPSLVSVDGGTFTLESGILDGANGILVENDGTVTISGGTVMGDFEYGLCLDGGSATITGGTIDGYAYGVKIENEADELYLSGNATITGGMTDIRSTVAITPIVVTSTPSDATQYSIDVPTGVFAKPADDSVTLSQTNFVPSIDLAYGVVLNNDGTLSLLEKAEITGDPTIIDGLTYSGWAQQLIAAGTAEGGTMMYSLDGENWSEERPTATDAGEYRVFYYAKSDNTHADSDIESLTGCIDKLDITVIADDCEMTYGETFNFNEYEISGLTEDMKATVILAASTDQATDVGEVLVSGVALLHPNVEGVVDIEKNIDLTKVSGTLVIEPVDVNSCTLGWAEDVNNIVYNGTEKKPGVRLAHYTTYLEEGTDYTLSYVDNINAGWTTVVITGTGNFTGERETMFQIKPAPSVLTVAPQTLELTYTGEPQQLLIPGECEGGTLMYSLDGENWSDEIPTATDAGTITVGYYIQGDENHTSSNGSLVQVTIAKLPVTVTAGDCEMTYGEVFNSNDYVISDLPEGIHATVTLTASADYVTDNGTINIQVEFSNSFGELSLDNFDVTLNPGKLVIKPYDISGCGLNWLDSSNNYYYDGTAKKPRVEINGDGGTLVEGRDYTLTYQDNVNAGTATILMTGKGNYSGELEYQFTISPVDATVTSAPTPKTLTANGKAQALVKAGTGKGGTMMYSLDGANWSEEIPTATDAGEYTVSYYVKGDSNHLDSLVMEVNVSIAPAPTEPTEPDDTKPTEPEETKPTEPESTKPTEPESTKPTEPEETKPTEPEGTKPTEPEETNPSEPEDTKPTEPEETKPTEPESTKPTEPESTNPTEPEETKPTEPDATEPEAVVCPGDDTCPTAHFVDVDQAQWYHKGIDFAYSNGLMKGTSSITFAPGLTTTRGMIATILYAMEGRPEVEGESTFSDVNDEWYANAVIWAQQNGVVAGYTDGTFRPNAEVTREQLATMLYAYAKYKGYDTSYSGDLSVFPDQDKISGYAVKAMTWANGAGLISGTKVDGQILIAPQGSALRSQAAVMLMRFCEAFDHKFAI